jgi:hypothetical protein
VIIAAAFTNAFVSASGFLLEAHHNETRREEGRDGYETPANWDQTKKCDLSRIERPGDDGLPVKGTASLT